MLKSSWLPNTLEILFITGGDGTTSTSPVVTHRYEKGGNYTVTLKVTDESGVVCDTGMATRVVNVNIAPIAKISAPDIVCVGQDVGINGSASASETSKNLTYMWDLGDGTRAEGVNVTHKYEKGGSYKIKLTVNDNMSTDCSVSCDERCIRVNTAPVACAGKDVSMCNLRPADEYSVCFDGTGSYDPDRDCLTYMWDFGDGSTSTDAKVTHVYAKGGTYKAVLTVNDGTGTACATATDSITITLGKKLVSNAGKPLCLCLGEDANFDGSGSYVGEGGTPAYTWDFGDGTTGTGMKASHKYTTGGKHVVSLTVSNSGLNDACAQPAISSTCVVLNSPPVAVLASCGPACVGSKVCFDGSGSSDPDGDCLTYNWDFGDGVTKVGKAKETHVYEKGGTYKVKLTVDDGRGMPCSTNTTGIDVKINTPPVAKIGNCIVCCAGLEGTFDGSDSYDPDGDSLSYNWDFGDGGTATGAKVTHTYANAGKYKVTLTVDDNTGTPCSSASTCIETCIHANPQAAIVVKGGCKPVCNTN